MKDKDFINHFRKDSKHLDAKKSKPEPDPEKNNRQVETAKTLINAYREKYSDVDINVLRNLIELKDITQEQKKDKPDVSFNEINKRLGHEESIETLAQDRWHDKLHCTSCGSKKVKRLSVDEHLGKAVHKYQCQECRFEFDDVTGTPLESGVPPIHTWMMCWYLLGCTNSLQYISTKLGLDLPTIELMIRQMQKLFKAQKPLEHFLTFDEWSLRHGKSYKASIQNEMAKRQVLLGKDIANAPGDTAEYRRQKERAKDPLNRRSHLPKPPRNRGS